MFATAKNKHAADTYGLNLSPTLKSELLCLKDLLLTYYCRPSDDTFEAFLVLLVYVVWEHVSDVGAHADKEDNQCEEGLEIEKG